MTLEQELETFRRELPRLLSDPLNQGRFALIHGSDVVGMFDTFDEALAAGYDRFELDPFMVKQVQEHEKPTYFARHIRCP